MRLTKRQRASIESLDRMLRNLDYLAENNRLDSACRPMVNHCQQMLAEAFPEIS